MKHEILLATIVTLSLCNGAIAVAQMQHGDHGMAPHDMTHQKMTPHGMTAQGDRKVAVEGPWARASVGQTGAAFVTLVNRSDADDRLVQAKADVSARVELHTHIMDGNVMRMRHVESVPVLAGKTVTFKPGGLHVMLIGLKKKLEEGKSFPLTLVFEKAGEVTVDVPIGKIGAMGTGTMGNMGHMDHMGHDHMGSGDMGHGSMGSGDMKH